MNSEATASTELVKATPVGVPAVSDGQSSNISIKELPMGIWEGLKRGAKALIPDRSPGTFLAGGQRVTCPHCKSDTFLEGRILVPAFRTTLPHVDWLHGKPTTLMCDHCGLIQWFGVEPERSVTAQERPEGAGDA